LSFASSGPPVPRGRIAKWHQKRFRDLCSTLVRKASQACAYVPFTAETSCCRCAVLLKTGGRRQLQKCHSARSSGEQWATTGRIDSSAPYGSERHGCAISQRLPDRMMNLCAPPIRRGHLDRPERLLFNFIATSPELELKWRKKWTGCFSSSL
jgi:hypothetical protein